ncbi:hypothetical protein L1987_46412 [Smallanthus sonchifolius]|uniref:Uncharacterized protein n=1 Tax=Smallanthus sonchifolius TaxID=185202 RepID=A0ACB9G0M0_9ASTR|nr:hypothetical protein L1987_46412 [Smallanthus sonchifolius]
MSCYRIDNYICDTASNPPRVTLHPAIIRLSTTIVTNLISDPESFPTYQFNFYQYEQLASLIDRQQVFIDYAARLDGITDTTTKNDKPLARLRLTDIRKTDSLVKPQLLATSLIVLGSTEAVQTAEKKVYEKGNTWSCLKHENIIDPNFVLCVNTTITDDTGTATATFFNDAVVSLLGKECEEVVKEGYENEFEVPKSLSEAIGQKKILQIQFEGTPYRRSTHFVVSLLSSPSHQQLLPDSTPPPSTTTSEKAPIQEKVDKPLPDSTPPPSTTSEKAPMQEIVDKPSAKQQLFLEEGSQGLEIIISTEKMIGAGKMKQYTNVLDKPLSKGRQEVSLSGFAYLFSELVQYNQTQVDNIGELERRLEDAGYAVGVRVLELLCHREKGNRRETRLLGILSFVHSTVWKVLFGKVADSLEKGTEHEDEYMISEKELLVNRFISVPKDMGSFNCGAFVAGIVRGVLDNAGFPAVVTAHFVPVDGQQRPRTTILIKFAEEVLRREARLG